MKQKFTLPLVAASLLVSAGAMAETTSPEKAVRVADKSVNAPASAMVKSQAVNAGKSIISRADEGVYSYTDNLTGLLYLSMDETFHVPSEATTFIPPYQDITWTNTSTGFGSDKMYQWRYVDPTYQSYKYLTQILSYNENFTLNYHPRCPNPSGAIFPQLLGEGEQWYLVDAYCPGSFFPGGTSDMTNDGSFNFGVNPSANIGKVDYDLEAASFISSDYYTYNKEKKNEAWATELGDKFEGIVAFGNMYPQPMTPYSINRAWAYMVVEATAATSMKVNVYRVDRDGNVLREEPIAYGEAAIVEGTNKIIAADLTGLDEDGFESTDPIAVDFPIYVEFSDFADNAAIESVAPKLVIMEQYNAGEENPYEMNFRVAYKSGDDVTTAVPMWDIAANNEKTRLIAPANMGVSIAAVFPWCVSIKAEESEPEAQATDAPAENLYAFDAPAAGGEHVFTIDSYYAFGEDQKIEKEEGADWFEVIPGTTEEGITPVTVKVKALEGKGRSGKFAIKAPAVNVEFTVTQGEVSGISDIKADASVVATRYYDIYGRELKSAPANGLYIKKELKADGSSVIEKQIAR